MRDYFRRLKTHPGVPIVIALQIMGFVAGMTSPLEDHITRAIAGFLIMGIFWVPVFLSNMKR